MAGLLTYASPAKTRLLIPVEQWPLTAVFFCPQLQ